jgi:hypothetical protein
MQCWCDTILEESGGFVKCIHSGMLFAPRWSKTEDLRLFMAFDNNQLPGPVPDGIK